MRLPVLDGTIDRRLLVNYRVDPDIVGALLPEPLHPQVVNGYAVAGICLLRLSHLRPRGIPHPLGLKSENAAHRIAVEWQTDLGTKTGVYIPRRDTASLANVVAGGRLFPGEHHYARFTTREAESSLAVACSSRDESVRVEVEADLTEELVGSELFGSTDDASQFFERGSVGYSATSQPTRLDGVELQTEQWHIAPLRIRRASSSYFEDTDRFPPRSATLDSALLMRDVPVRWHSVESLTVDPSGVAHLIHH